MFEGCYGDPDEKYVEKQILNDERYSLKIFIPGIVRGKSFSSQISLV